MKRVCTLRKVLSFSFKGPLRKVIFYRSYIMAFYRHSVLIYFYDISCREICHGIATLNICIRKSFFLNFITTFATRILTYWYTVV